MNTTASIVSRRALRSPHWRWLCGMRAEGTISDPSLYGSPTIHTQFIVVDVTPEGVPLSRWDSQPIRDAIPVLTDPATLGALLSLVRQARSDEHFLLTTTDLGPQGHRWHSGTHKAGLNLTEGEALVQALEDTP